jgi:hypothetical protein
MTNPTINVSETSSAENRTFQQQFEQAQISATQANQTEPRAIAAHYAPTEHLIIIHLHSGARFSFPPDIAQGLAGANPAHLAAVEITPMGDGLHWEILDADFTVVGLLAGRFGTQKWMQQFNLKNRVGLT